MEGPGEHCNRVHQGIKKGATGGHGQNPPRAEQTGYRGTKRPEKGCKTPPNAKWHKENKDDIIIYWLKVGCYLEIYKSKI